MTQRSGRFLRWIREALSEPNGAASSRRCLFALAVVFALGLATGALCAQRGLSAETVDLLKTVLWVTGGVLGVGKFAEQGAKGGAEC